MQLGVGERARVARLAFPENGGARSPKARRQIAVEAVVRDVRLAADKPLGERLVPLERLFERLEPMQLLARSSPQNFGGSAAASSQIRWYSSSDLMRARAENSLGGGNSRFSCITVSICPPV